MAVEQDTITAFQEAPPRVNEWRRFWRVFLQRRVVIFGMVILGLLVIAAVFAPLLAPYDPYIGGMAASLPQPNRTYLLGTDIQGRDTLSRLIYGSRSVLIVGFVTVGVAAVFGIILGLTAGFFGGLASMVIMRVMDALMGFPMLLLALLLSAVLGGGIQNVIIALAVAML